MTNATSEVLQKYFHSHSFGDLTRTTSVLAIVLLLLVITEREILRATAVESGERRNYAAFAVVVLPMVVVFASVIVARFVSLS